MRVLRVHAPGTHPGLAESVGRAVAAFNRGLDIRLRFLAIGIEEVVIDAPDAACAAERVAASLGSPGTEFVVLLGEGPAALAAATAAARARVAVVRVGAGRRDEPNSDCERGTDRLSAVHLVYDDADLANLALEGSSALRLAVGAPGDPTAGERVVRALSRARASSNTRTTGDV